jgi:hypothetical protein
MRRKVLFTASVGFGLRFCDIPFDFVWHGRMGTGVGREGRRRRRRGNTQDYLII